jgi:hypothetical protein
MNNTVAKLSAILNFLNFKAFFHIENKEMSNI